MVTAPSCHQRDYKCYYNLYKVVPMIHQPDWLSLDIQIDAGSKAYTLAEISFEFINLFCILYILYC